MTNAVLLCLLAFSVCVQPAGAETISVRTGDDLQAALERARPGDVVALEAHGIFVGNFVLPAKPVTSQRFITLRTAIPDSATVLPGWRVSPAAAVPFAKIRSANSTAALRTAPGAHHWRLELLEFQANAGGAGTIIELGDGSPAQSSMSQVPYELIVDRCYIHGDPEKGQKRGVGLNSGATIITGSHVSDIKVVGQDSQAIAGWNGPGPYRIENNYLEAAGENFLLGGAVPAIRDLIPSDVLFRRNHVTRPGGWRQERWSVKNLFELKNARRVMVDGNVFETHWSGAQAGYAIVLTPRGEEGKAAWAVVEDVTFQFNIVRDVAAGINILGHDDGGASGLARRIRIANNLFYRLDREWGGNGFFLLIGNGPEQIAVDHNTIIQAGNVVSAYGESSGRPVPIAPFSFTNNLALHNANGVHGQGQAVGAGTLEAYFPDFVFKRNVLAGGNASRYPPGNEFPGEAEFARSFANYAAGDYRLNAGSSYRSAGTDGRDLGADTVTLLKKTKGVERGTPEEGVRLPRR